MKDGLLAQINKRLGIIVGLLSFVAFVLGAAFAYVHPGSPGWVPASRSYAHEYYSALLHSERLEARISLNRKMLDNDQLADEDREKIEEVIQEQEFELSVLRSRYQLDQ